jgi:hypothetical protein
MFDVLSFDVLSFDVLSFDVLYVHRFVMFFTGYRNLIIWKELSLYLGLEPGYCFRVRLDSGLG